MIPVVRDLVRSHPLVEEVSGFRDPARLELSLKYLVVCGIVLTLGTLGPQQSLDSPFDSLWALGALAIMSFVCHQIAAYLRLPQLVGWMAAGLIMGMSGLQIVRPAEHVPVEFLFSLATVWVGFQVGTGLAWARAMSLPVFSLRWPFDTGHLRACSRWRHRPCSTAGLAGSPSGVYCQSVGACGRFGPVLAKECSASEPCWLRFQPGNPERRSVRITLAGNSSRGSAACSG